MFVMMDGKQIVWSLIGLIVITVLCCIIDGGMMLF
jgi:hypothetical protein